MFNAESKQMKKGIELAIFAYHIRHGLTMNCAVIATDATIDRLRKQYRQAAQEESNKPLHDWIDRTCFRYEVDQAYLLDLT
jgi:hypothetical protein